MISSLRQTFSITWNEATADKLPVCVCVCTEDTVAFWRGVKESGLLEEVVEGFQKELQDVLKGLQERVCDPPLQVKG